MDKFYKILRIIVMIIIIISFCTKIFAASPIAPYNSTYYIEITNHTNNTTRRLCSNNSFQLVPNGSLSTYYDSISLSNSNYVSGSLFSNGNFQYNYAGSQIIGSISDTNLSDYTITSSFPTKVYSKQGTLIYDTYNPYITTLSTDINNWSFEYLDICLGGIQFESDFVLAFTYNDNSYGMSLVSDFILYDTENNIISIPKQMINNYITFITYSDISFKIQDAIGAGGIREFELGTFSVSLTDDEVYDYNSSADRNVQNNIYNELSSLNDQWSIFNNNWQNYQDTAEDTNEAVKEINNTLTDDTVESGASDLPSTDVTDPSSNGIDNIFQSIYNAFCTGQAQDIVFPIPFTNKNITLPANYVESMLKNNNATWIYTIIQAFWGYLIGRFIVKDISKKITKIKGGNIENIENENIKEEML